MKPTLKLTRPKMILKKKDFSEFLKKEMENRVKPKGKGNRYV